VVLFRQPTGSSINSGRCFFVYCHYFEFGPFGEILPAIQWVIRGLLLHRPAGLVFSAVFSRGVVSKGSGLFKGGQFSPPAFFLVVQLSPANQDDTSF
jgi:hypothetical protein